MPSDCERQILALDSRAVIGEAQPLDAAARDIDIDLCRAGIEAVLEQLLQCRRRPLDDLAGSDLIDQEIGERADRMHGLAMEVACPTRVDAVGNIVKRRDATVHIIQDVYA